MPVLSLVPPPQSPPGRAPPETVRWLSAALRSVEKARAMDSAEQVRLRAAFVSWGERDKDPRLAPSTAERYHRTVWGQEVQGQSVGRVVPSELLLGLPGAVFIPTRRFCCVCLCVQISPSYKDTSHWSLIQCEFTLTNYIYDNPRSK